MPIHRGHGHRHHPATPALLIVADDKGGPKLYAYGSFAAHVYLALDGDKPAVSLPVEGVGNDIVRFCELLEGMPEAPPAPEGPVTPEAVVEQAVPENAPVPAIDEKPAPDATPPAA